MKSEWMESTGGPLVLLPRSRAPQWLGVEGHDYADACAVSDYAGLLERSWGQVIVLGDEPFRTTIVRREDGDRIVRWMYAPDEQAALAVAMAFDPAGKGPSEVLKIAVDEEVYLLIDSATSGAEASGLEVRVPAKVRLLNTFVLKQVEVGLIVHVFE